MWGGSGEEVLSVHDGQEGPALNGHGYGLRPQESPVRLDAFMTLNS